MHHTASLLTRRAAAALLGLVPAFGADAATTGSGRVATETREISGFAAIALRGNIDLVVRQGTREAVQVSTEDNLLPLLQTTLEDGRDGQRTLRIQWKNGESVRSTRPAVVTVDLIRLAALSAGGSGDITVEPLKTPSLSLSISGSSNARLRQLDTDQFTLGIAGSGSVQAAGKAARLEISIAGSGDVRARELVADDASVSIAGSGNASVNAAKTLAVAIAGSGDVDYPGGAALTRNRIAGSGTIRHRP